MAYYDYLRGLLEPLGIYDLESHDGGAELRCIGEQLDGVFELYEEFGREIIPLTADGYGLFNFEELFPYRPSYITPEDRRRAVAALLRIRNGCFTVAALCDTLSGCGINALVSESGEPMTVEVTFPDNRGVPEDIERIKERVEQILPCHLAVTYRYTYAVWSDIAAGISSWGALHTLCDTWKAMEIFMG